MSIPQDARRRLYALVNFDISQKTGVELRGAVDNFLVDLVDAAKGTDVEDAIGLQVREIRQAIDTDLSDMAGVITDENERLQFAYSRAMVGAILPMFHRGQLLGLTSGGRKTRRKRGGEDKKSQRKSAIDMLSSSDKASEPFPAAEGVGKGFVSVVEARAARERAKELEALRAQRPVSRPSSPTPEEGGRRKTSRKLRRRRMTRRRR